MQQHEKSRRDFLRTAAKVTIGGVVAGQVGLLSWAPRAYAASVAVNLTALGGDLSLPDATNVPVRLFMLAFSATGSMAASGPTIVCQSGDQIALTLSNRLNAPVEFRVGGTNIAVTVGAGQTTRQPYTFSAPAPGTYLYYDGQNGGVNRVMGLHGALVVMPAGVKNRSYVGGPSFWRQYKWLLNSIDSAWSQRLRSGGLSAARGIVPMSFQPRYFTVNGRNFPATHEPNTELAGNYGEAALVRCLNAGGMVHALHFHGNHVKVVSINRSQENLRDKDIIPMLPLDCRDAIFPFAPPPDAWPAVNGSEQHYPMHCHVEMSQTAGGGSYPHGLHAPIVFGRGPMQEPDLTRDVAVLR